VRELEDHRIPRTIVSEILTEDLGMKRVVAKSVPRLLSQQQKEFCAEVTQDLLETANKDPDFLKKSQQEMSHGSTAMALKQKPSLSSGRRLSPHVRRRRGKVGAKSTPC
jgi:hypothetical protein